MATVISILNLKGGVGKTTTTVALAEFLRARWEKRVLLVDLDPQTNATVAFISVEHWKSRNDAKQTLAHLFRDQLDGTNHFSLKDAVLNEVSSLELEGRFGKVSLLPSSLEFIDLQDSLSLINQQTLYAINPVEVLSKTLEPILHEYDFVLIDCPPNLGNITLNGILLSDYYLIPTIPDHLSKMGIPQVIGRIRKFKERRSDCRIEALGIVANLVRGNVNMHPEVIGELQNNPAYPKVFKSQIPLAVAAARPFDFEFKPKTLSQKYPPPVGAAYEALTKEILDDVESGS